jgi:hypothetical protein
VAAVASVAAAAAATDRNLVLSFWRRSGNAPAPFSRDGTSWRTLTLRQMASKHHASFPTRPLPVPAHVVAVSRLQLPEDEGGEDGHRAEDEKRAVDAVEQLARL